MANFEKYIHNKEESETAEVIDEKEKLMHYKKLHNKITELVNAVDSSLLDKRREQYRINKDSDQWSWLSTPDKFTKAIELAYKQLDNRNQENLSEFMKMFIPLLNDLVNALKENNETLEWWLTIVTNKEEFDKIIVNMEEHIFKQSE